MKSDRQKPFREYERTYEQPLLFPELRTRFAMRGKIEVGGDGDWSTTDHRRFWSINLEEAIKKATILCGDVFFIDDDANPFTNPILKLEVKEAGRKNLWVVVFDWTAEFKKDYWQRAYEEGYTSKEKAARELAYWERRCREKKASKGKGVKET